MSGAQYVVVHNRYKKTKKRVMISNKSKPEPNHIMLYKWQNMLDFVANLFGVQSSRITRIDHETIDTILENNNTSLDYNKVNEVGNGSLDEMVIGEGETLAIENLKSDQWPYHQDHPKAYLGMPIKWPDNEIFGTLTIMDQKAQNFTDRYYKILSTFKDMVNTDLALLLESDTYAQKSKFAGGKMPMLKTGVCLYDENGIVKSWNQSAIDILGYKASEVLNSKVKMIFPMLKHLEQRQILSVVSKDQEVKILLVELDQLIVESDMKLNVIAFTDQTEINSYQNNLGGELHKDEETGLYNQSSIEDILTQENKRSLRYQQDLSIIVIQIDGYNFIETLHGDGSLDLIVQTLAIILKNETRDVDSIGRLAEDIFIISLPSTNRKSAAGVARRIERVTSRYSDEETPFTITAIEHQVEDSVSDWLELTHRILAQK